MRHIIPRLIKAGGINPNLNSTYENMEEKLEEVFKKYNGLVPLFIKSDDHFDTTDYTKVIGMIMGYSSEYFVVEVYPYKEFIFNEIKNPKIGMSFSVPNTELKPIRIKDIIKFELFDGDKL